MVTLTSVTVSVPDDTISDLYAYAAELVAGATNGTSSADNGSGRKVAKWGQGREAVKKAYRGGVSDYWRPFLEALAEHPDEWVDWHMLCTAIDLTPRQASGMLGAAERRCKRLPYEKMWEGGERYFLMSAAAANVIRELAGDE